MNHLPRNARMFTSLRSLAMATVLTVFTSTVAAAQSTTSDLAVKPAAPDAPLPVTLRIAVPLPAVDFGGTFDGAAEALQSMLAAFLQGPKIEVVPLQARVPTLITREAQQRQVDYIVTMELTRKVGGASMWNKVSPGAATAVMAAPGLGTMATKVSTAVAVSSALQTASLLDGSVQAKDTVKLRYSLQKADGTVAHEADMETRATAAGESIVQPLMHRMVTHVVEMVVTGKVTAAPKR